MHVKVKVKKNKTTDIVYYFSESWPCWLQYLFKFLQFLKKIDDPMRFIESIEIYRLITVSLIILTYEKMLQSYLNLLKSSRRISQILDNLEQFGTIWPFLVRHSSAKPKIKTRCYAVTLPCKMGLMGSRV
jgi:hypothetical protein